VSIYLSQVFKIPMGDREGELGRVWGHLIFPLKTLGKYLIN
jgi:hypothetical protein